MRKTRIRHKLLAVAGAMIFTVACVSVAFAEETSAGVTEVSTADELLAAISQTNGNSPVENLSIKLVKNIDLGELTAGTWNPGQVNGYVGAKNYSIDGNNHYIEGLTTSLFDKTWAGKSTLYIRDLTIKNSTIKNGTGSGDAVGAFVGFSNATPSITLYNCHVENCTIGGGHYAGGLIGYCAGYSTLNDGPVFEEVLIAAAQENSPL